MPADAAEDRIRQLESELEDMTGALVHAWDQLVPFLQSAPQQVDSSEDVIPILESIMTAVEAEMGAVYLAPRSTDQAEWIVLPANAVDGQQFEETLRDLIKNPTVLPLKNVASWTGRLTNWLFVPILVGYKVVGTIGVGLLQGARDFNAGEARILSRMTERAAAQIVVANLAESQARERQLAQELQIAGLIQRSIQPADEPAIFQLQVAALWQPAQNVGGDAWGWVLQPSGRLACFILDIAGKGLPAALGAVALHTAFKLALRLGLSPVETLRKVNEEFYDAYTNAGIMATASVIVIDPINRTVEQAGAGHPPALIRQSGKWLRWKSTMPPLGTLPDITPRLQSTILSPGDLVICYTDGYSEIDTEHGLWGDKGIQQAVLDGLIDAHQVIKAIQTGAERVQGNHAISDDQTLLAIGFEGQIIMHTTLVIPATFEALEQLSPFMSQATYAAPARMQAQLALAVHELCMNIVQHAYAGTPGEIRLEVDYSDHSLQISIYDQGPNAYAATEVVEPDPFDLPEHGWGIAIVHRVMDNVYYEHLESGSQWRLIKSW